MSRKRNSGFAALIRILENPRASIPSDPPPQSSSLHLLPSLNYEPLRHPKWTVVRSADGVGVTIRQAGSVIMIVPAEIPALLSAIYRVAG
jgi:hypothetical protein